MLNTEADPRVYFAAERTLLAWIRTGMTIMAFGFVVARFGLFLRLLRAEGEPVGNGGVSPYLGSVLVVIGVVAISAGTKRYQEFCRLLGRSSLPSPHAEVLPQILGWSLAVLGVALVAILLW
ncbi:MAG: YidH family protein [Gemmatimonadales bacterium]